MGTLLHNISTIHSSGFLLPSFIFPMALPRSAALRGSIRSFVAKRIGTQARTTLRNVGRRTYAQEHSTKKSSDLPWLVGSLVVTVPAAGWLWQQGPSKSDHGHGHAEHKEEAEETSGEEHAEEEQPKDEPEESKEEEGKDDNADKESGGTVDEGADTKGSPDGKERATTEKAGEKQAQGDVSGASNPFLYEGDRSKKAEGPGASARIHGTVDSARPIGGHKDPEKSQPHAEEKDMDKEKSGEK